MATFKYQRALADSQFNVDKLLNELTVATGHTPLWSWSDAERTIICLDFPDGVDGDLVSDIVLRNFADEEYTTEAILFGPETSSLDSRGMIARTAGGGAELSTADGVLNAAGGKVVIGTNAIVIDDMLYALTAHDTAQFGDHRYFRWGLRRGLDNVNPEGILSYNNEPGANLISNPGFETGSFSGWSPGAGVGDVIEVSSAKPHDGTYSAHGSLAAGGTIDVTSDRFAVTPLGIYELSCWIYLQDVPSAYNDPQLVVFWYDVSSGGTELAIHNISLPHTILEWRQAYGLVQAPGNATYAEVILVYSNNDATEIYVDEIALKPVTLASWMTFDPDIRIFGADLYVKDNKVHAGDVSGYQSWTNQSTAQIGYDRSILALSMGPNGSLEFDCAIRLKTTNAVTKNMVIAVYLGSTAIFAWTSPSTGAVSGNEVHSEFKIRISNVNDNAIQVASITGKENSGGAPGSDPTTPTIRNLIRTNGATEDTTGDLNFQIRIAPSSGNNILELIRAKMVGPDYKA